MPVGEQLLAPPPSGTPHVPVVFAPVFTQLPEQHSLLNAQISLFCVQNETPSEQRPPLQKFEQQSPVAEHGLPAVRHVEPGLTEAHLPPPVPSGAQIPLQQSSFLKHDPAVGLSGTHCLFEQVPLVHEPVQHSVPALHTTPGSLQALFGGSHVPAVPPSVPQFAEQQSLLAPQP